MVLTADDRISTRQSLPFRLERVLISVGLVKSGDQRLFACDTEGWTHCAHPSSVPTTTLPPKRSRSGAARLGV